MKNKFTDIDNRILTCKKHLKKSKAEGTEIETIITQYLLIYICGEYEKEIRNIVTRKADKSNDNHLASFVKKSLDIRSMYVGDLKGNILKKFDISYATNYESELATQQEAISYYHNILTNRNQSAHGNAINITFSELASTYKKANRIITTLEKVLC